MCLTAKEREVVGLLRQCGVATSGRLCQELHVSYWTVLRGLQKHGYYTSFNCNSAYFTLAGTPAFDADGLWFYEEIGFSLYRTLGATLAALVEGSEAGCTAREMEARLHTRVGNLLSRACLRGELGRWRGGREVVYLSGVPQRAEEQRSRRQEQRTPALGAWGRAFLPAGMEVRLVVEVLVQWIREPAGGPAEQAQALRARGVGVADSQVRRIAEFYELGKKGAL